jgi:hypothetical protein
MAEDALGLPVLALVRDMIFASKIAGTARASGTTIKMLRDPAQLAGQAGRLLIVDLNLEGAIEAASEWKRIGGGDLVGFVSHVDSETIGRARSAGIEKIMARSQFVQDLAALLGGGRD